MTRLMGDTRLPVTLVLCTKPLMGVYAGPIAVVDVTRT